MTHHLYSIRRILSVLLLLIAAGGNAVAQTALTAYMFHSWDGPGAGATDNGEVTGTAYNLNTSTDLPYGDGNVYYLNYADLSDYKTLELVVLEGAPRLLFNRQTDNGNDYLEINSTSHNYVKALNSIWIIDLEKIRVNNGGFVHLNCIKGANYANVNIKSMKLRNYPTELSLGLFKVWNDVNGEATENTEGTNNGQAHFNETLTNGGTVYGTDGVLCHQYANLSPYSKMIIAYSGDFPRLLFNRQNDNSENNGLIDVGSVGDYATIEDGLIIVDLDKLRSVNGGYLHLNSIKAPWGGTTNVFAAHLYTEAQYTDINTFTLGDDSNCETHVLYQLDPNSGTFTVDLAKFKDKILDYFGKSSVSDFNNLYLRWYVIDNTTNMYLPVQNEILSAVGNSGGEHHLEDIGMLWFHNGYGTAPTDENIADVLNANVTLPSGKTASNVTMVCVMTDDLSDLYMKHEPQNLKHKIYIRFINSWTAMNNNFFKVADSSPTDIFSTQLKVEQGATATGSEQLQTALINLYNQAASSATSLNGATPKYVRVYLTNANGTKINAAKSDNWTLYFSQAAGNGIQNKISNGYVWAKNDNQTWLNFNANNIFNTVLTKPDGYDWKNVRVVCDLTDDLTGSYFVGDGIMEEPTNLKARLVVSFKEDNGDNYSATASDLTTGMSITRKHNSTETAELDLATSEHFSDVNAAFGNHLNDNSNVEKLYIRWYLADADGEWVPTPEGITLSPVNSNYADKVVDGKNFGKVLHLGNTGGIVTADMLKMNIEVANTSIDLNDYHVACALAYADDGYTTEPSPLKVKYIYSFVSPFEGKLSGNAFTHTKEVTVTRDDQIAGYVTIPLDTYYSELLSDYNTNATDLGKNLHIRWYVMHDGEQYRRSDLQLLGVNNSDYKTYVGANDKDGYLYWNTATSASTTTEGKLNVKFTIPTTDTHWENYKIVAVMSNDISAENGQVVSEGVLVKEPQSLNMIYTFSLIDGVFKFVHHKGASGRDYFTHNDDVNINAPSGEFTMSQTTIFLPTEANVIGGRGDGIFTSDRYTLGTAKESNVDPATGGAAPEGAKYGGLTVKKDNPNKTAIFKVTGVNSVVAYLVSTNKTESRTCFAKATPTDGSAAVEVSGTSDKEGSTAVITLTLDPTKEYVVDFSDSRKTGTDNGADMSLLGVRFVIDGTEPHLYAPTQYTQYSWDNENGKVVTAERGDIRQGVHTVNYDVFINPTDGAKILKLPFEAYLGNGNNLEPMAYIRWYDWSSDLGSSSLNRVGTWLKQLDDDAGNRGFFMLNNSLKNQNPTHAKVGVTYDPTSLTTDGDIIACDVSKYYDGLYPGHEADDRPEFAAYNYPQFVHEPTLSTRYLYHIYPSSVIAEKIAAGHNALQNGFNSLNGGTAYTAELETAMFNNIYEDNGRVVVSLNGSEGEFALRADLYSLDNYYVNGGNSQCDHITWRAYLEDERGLWRRSSGAVISNSSSRIQLLTLSSLSGEYSLLSNPSTVKSVTAAPGMRFHLVGCVGSTTEDEQAAVHYELQFLDAPAIMAENLAATNVKRTSAYLEQNFRKGGVVNFDNYFADTAQPTTESQNMLFSPIPWKEAEYGFCYPKIDKYRIRTGWSGLTPIHGDYMLVKSMLVPGVSDRSSEDGETPGSGCEYSYHWYTYEPAAMYDYTNLVSPTEYGGYIYVDASDESRTIATLDFTANLCSGSQIYFTAAIADVTSSGATSPQLMAHVYARDEFGDKIQVMSFLTSVLNTVNTGDEGTYKYNKWYQVYGHGNIPENIDISKYTDFSVEIDNYSKNTQGADFCVDQIVFYTSTGKMQVEQTGGQCQDEDLSITAYMDVEHLEAMVTLGDTPKTLYYRIYQKTGSGNNGEILYQAYPDASIYNNNGKSYGQVETYKYVVDQYGALDNSTETNRTRNKPYEVRNGILYFKLIENQVFNLPQGNEYYIAMTENLYYPNPDDDINGWANPNDPCDVYSNFFVPRKTFISFLNSESQAASTTIISNCDNYSANDINYTLNASVPDENEPSGFKIIPGVKYDFFIGTLDELKPGGEYDGLVAAMKDFRDCELRYYVRDYSTEPKTDYRDLGETQASYYAIINRAYSAGKLMMSASETLVKRVLETTDFVALPVKEVYTVGNTDYHLCDYLPFTITVNGYPGVPELMLGFDDVDYTTAGTERVLRVGLEQLNKMKTLGYKLHIPINGYKDKKKGTSKKLYFPSDSYLTISAVDKTTSPTTPNTTDPTLPEVGTKFAKIVPINAEESRPSVDKNHMYLSLDLSECAIVFHEGYQYEVSTSFLDEDDENVTNPCIGDLFILIKVVPEFVTWQSQPVGEDGKTTTSSEYYSANWYNDGNWKRSTRAELYKDEKGGSQNTVTAGHPNGYENNGEGSLSSLSGNSGFVPMKFTYVTLPTGNHAPSLINEPRVTGVGVGSRRQGGGFLDLTQTTLLTDRSPRDPDGTPDNQRTNSKPTENIYYDMLVRYSYSETDKFGEGCFGHRYMKEDGTWDDQGEENLSAKVFDVEKFQGNICNEIYFKPGAELLRQQRLTYKRAWVETELYANKWYLLASPLQCTYAGDMYVPFANGRQETEAFQPITFDKSKGYSRTKYPIYQRSWGMNNGNVYTKQNDIRANSYSANLKYNTVTTNLVEWGHTFNDVQVPYHTSETALSQNLAGFSIRAHKKAQTDKALIRLPKADTSYEYYDWTDTNSDPAATGVKAVSKTDFAFQQESETLFTVPYCYRLVTDEHQHDGDLEYSISAMQQNGDYVLVGNPYMVSIDMKKFFETNTALSTDGYWTYEGSTATAYTVPTQTNTQFMKPMQGFFVKKGTATSITFNKGMQVDGNFPPPASVGGNARAVTLTLRTANSLGGSSANVELNEKASANYAGVEDVETLFDSNLSDVPMVYTVAADGRAVSVDNRPSMEMVPFGVACAASDELVEVTVDISDLSPLASHLFIWDAVTGETKEVGEGSALMVQPNDYGRYFLTTRSDLTAIDNASATDGIMVSVRNRQLTVRSASELTSVRVLTTGGETVQSLTGCGNEVVFNLTAGGIYIIEAQTENDRKTLKVITK